MSMTTRFPCDHLSKLGDSTQVWNDMKKWYLSFLTQNGRKNERIELKFCPECGRRLAVIIEK